MCKRQLSIVFLQETREHWYSSRFVRTVLLGDLNHGDELDLAPQKKS